MNAPTKNKNDATLKYGLELFTADSIYFFLTTLTTPKEQPLFSHF